MRLKVNDTEEFNLTLDLNVDYDQEVITVMVRLWDKKKHEIIDKEFDADEFGKALAFYRWCEEDYISGKYKLLPWRIWYRFSNIDGEIISEGVSTQVYVRKENAVVAAKKLYNFPISGMNKEWAVSRTNPWAFIEHEGVVHGFVKGF